MTKDERIHRALAAFAEAVKAKMSSVVAGQPEDQLRTPFENLMGEFAAALGVKVTCTGEAHLSGRIGRPDYAIHNSDLLAGYVELKAPGTGAVPGRFSGHNKRQWQHFQSLPNLMYCDGNEWALYHSGQLQGKAIRLSGDIVADGRKAATLDDALALERLLRLFLSWEPAVPTDGKGRIDLKGFAAMLAPLCRMVREDVAAALQDSGSPLVHLAKDWRHLLFPEAPNDQFADAYAQTVAFALLLARSEGADPLTLEHAEGALAMQHSLLSRALRVLTDPQACEAIGASLNVLIRVLGVVPPGTLAGPEDPWLYFYEDFLAAYDPKLRKDAGAYYTPVQVVRAQVRLVDDLLVHRLGKPLGFLDPGVVTLDPAAGTGTYLLGIIEHALDRVATEQGTGAVPGQASALGSSLYGFEFMVGPYAVAELRVSRALRDRGASLPAGGLHVYLTDTLESPHVQPQQPPLILMPLAVQHAAALQIKSNVPVIVCLGNPPYDRHEAAAAGNKARTGGWVRWGDEGSDVKPVLRSFVDPAKAAGHGGDLKNLYNLYVYFWRWALWKVFEASTASGPGIVSFISASSYVDGDAFCGMREHLRRLCDDVWILDLAGEGRGARKTENVFAIQTPVAIAIAVRSGPASPDMPAKVHYARLEGTRKGKLTQLDEIGGLASVSWVDCPNEWQAPFRPAGAGAYFTWPLLTDLMPWQHSGVKAGRTWVIAPEEAVLGRRWQALMTANGGGRRRELFKDSPTGRKAHQPASQLPPGDGRLPCILDIISGAQPHGIVRLAYRPFYRQFVIADPRVLDRPAPDLWRAHSERQIYLTSLLSEPLGHSAAVTCCAFVPDLHHFSGRGAKDVVPLFRNPEGADPNILPGLLDVLGRTYGVLVTPEDVLAYIYGVLAQPAFTREFEEELESRQLRVPITRDGALFARVCDVGRRLLWLHTYGERFVPEAFQRGTVPPGEVRCEKSIPGTSAGYPEAFSYKASTQTLHVGDGEFRPVHPQVYEFEVSGLKVVQSWLKYRMKKGGGKKSSPLDEIRPECWSAQFTTELLQLLWVLEHTIACYPKQAQLLEQVTSGPCLGADELPPVPASMRKPPSGHGENSAKLPGL